MRICDGGGASLDCVQCELLKTDIPNKSRRIL